MLNATSAQTLVRSAWSSRESFFHVDGIDEDSWYVCRDQELVTGMGRGSSVKAIRNEDMITHMELVDPFAMIINGVGDIQVALSFNLTLV
jgi:hypothetical protein